MVNGDQNIMVILSSPSGVGKTTLTKKIQQKYRSFKISVSHTTRAARSNEVEGVDYFFINHSQFEKLIKEVAKLVNNKIFTFYKESKENDELYGSIKPKEITNLIKEKVNADVAPSQVILKDELNKIGLFKVDINFHADVKANISIKIDKIQSK